jgi:hypothetical protein
MEHGALFHIEDSYWALLKGLNSEMKLRLIARLSKSVADETAVRTRHNDTDINKFYGAWKDERSAEQIIADIRNDRVLGTRQIENFDD